MRAVFTFRHQTVIDPRTLRTVPLMPYTSAVASLDRSFLGPLLPSDVAAQVATGTIHPATHLPMGTAEVMEEEERSLVEEGAPTETASTRPESPAAVRFSSPFVSVSFRALIEKPSERGLAAGGGLGLLDAKIKQMNAATLSVAPKREFQSIDGGHSVVAESPPRKRMAGSRVMGSPFMGNPVTGNPATGNPAMGNPAMGNRVEESPVINRNSFLDRFRSTVVGNSSVCWKQGVKE